MEFFFNVMFLMYVIYVTYCINDRSGIHSIQQLIWGLLVSNEASGPKEYDKRHYKFIKNIFHQKMRRKHPNQYLVQISL
jgi:hypothetical protein